MKKVCVFLSLFCLALEARAQVESPREIRLVTFAATVPDKPLFYKNGNVVEEFLPSVAGSGGSLAYRGPRRLILHWNEASFSAPADEIPTPAGSVDLPEGVERVLLVVVPKEDGVVTLVPYDISAGTMQTGDYRVFNFSSNDIAAIFGNQRVAIPAGANRVISGETWGSKPFALPVRLGVVAAETNRIQPVYSRMWEYYPERRSFVFLFGGGGPSVGVRTFFEVLRP